jgi:polar amino acid transport system substrate-binding protein
LLLLIFSSACARAQETRSSGEYDEREPGTLTVGSEIPFEPFEFEVDGKLTGFDVELVREIAKEIGLTPKFLDRDFDKLLDQVVTAQLDIAASAIRVTDERMQKVDFTNPYYIAQQALVVNSTRSPDITSTDHLGPSHILAVQNETTGRDWAGSNLGERGVQLRVVEEAPEMYDSLENGTITALISDEPSALIEANNRSGLKVVQSIDTGERYGFAVNPELILLLEAVNKALQKLIDNGTYDRIYSKYDKLGPNGSVTKNLP